MTPQALKASILQLAIQGKLVPQRPEEGTAEELYQQIQAEKQQLIANGTIKREKALPPIKENEIPFDIPETWKWVHINQIAHSILGKMLDKEKNKGNPHPYLCGINVYWEGINLDVVRTSNYQTEELEKYRLQKGDLLICEGGDAGRCAIWEHSSEMMFQKALHRIRFHGGISPYFYRYLIEYYKISGLINAYCKGQTIKHLVQGSLHQMWIPLPPLEEQKLIVAKIEEMLPLIDRYGEAYAELETFNKRFPDDLRKSILQEAIQGKLVPQLPEEGTAEELFQQIQAEKKRLIASGTIKKEKPLPPIEEKDLPFDIPETWKWVQLSTITYPVGNKNNQILSKEVLEEGDYPAVSQGAALIDGYTNEKAKVITDIPLVMFGDHTRNVKLIDFPFVISADGTKFMKPVIIEPAYLYYWMSITAEKLKNRGYARHFSLLNAELVPLPPLAEQKRIVAKIEEMLTLCKELS